MLIHVVTEVLEQRDFLGETVWKHVQSVEMFGAVALDVLHVSTNDTKQPVY